MPQPKFFKQYRRLAASRIERKSRFMTATYGWRRSVRQKSQIPMAYQDIDAARRCLPTDLPMKM
jgi:hypothetical protein